MWNSSRRTKSLVYGLISGVAYGVFLRSVANIHFFVGLFSVMSVGFLFLGPVAIGAVSIKDKNQSTLSTFFWPTLPVILACLVTLLLNWEGMICIVMYLPVGIVFGGIGGLLGRRFLRKDKSSALYATLLLPFVSIPIESRLTPAARIHEVESSIIIEANENKVWDEIKSVRTITKEEMPDSWVHRMGFPRPLDAEINREGVGGVRLARFAGDLTFNETVTTWSPNRELAFTIVVKPGSVPATTLDEHVTIGGRYFDVLNGRYVIEGLKGGLIQLHLTSRFRFSTHFNLYAGAWASLIMNRIQNDILSVVKLRAESPQKL